ncbi:MAG: ketoacyl-ACP synthase III [Cytophagaceae bacterium]|nr:ketoacyl-ACP synthase III [Cytophagaceae bacterium]MDW8456781.1 beta-ketoacyl-ACP synthase III [Cytophagaceae bacterium]
MTKIRAAITGVGGYVPEYILTNSELEKMVDTTDEWITTRTGIKERRLLKGEGMGTSHMMEKAVNELLHKTRTNPLEIDLVICCTTTPDMVFPATGNLVSDMCGLKNAFSYDLNAACSGFIFGLVTGSQFIETGKYKKVIVLGGDKMSSIINYKDRTTCIIFGDGAAAVLLEPDTSGNGILDSILRTDGSGAQYLCQKAGGSRRPPSIETVTNNEHYAYQEGATVFKYAVANMADVSVQIMKQNNLKPEDIAWLAPHQANKRIISATYERMGIGEEKVLMNIERYGNTTNGTIPLLLWDFEKKLKKGDNIIMSAFGGGFTWGAVYLKWAYNASE